MSIAAQATGHLEGLDMAKRVRAVTVGAATLLAEMSVAQLNHALPGICKEV